MLRGEVFGRVVRWAIGRPVVVLAVAGLLALAGAGLALQLDTNANVDTLVDRDSATFQANERFKRDFGEDAIVVLVKGKLQNTLLTSDLGRVLSLEGCLSGNVPRERVGQLPAPCRELARTQPTKVVYGPGTFINTAATRIAEGFAGQSAETERKADVAAESARKSAAASGLPKARQRALAQAARDLVKEDFNRRIVSLGLKYGLTGVPTIDNPQFVSSLVFDTSRGTNTPKARFAYLFPAADAALIQVRLKSGLSEDDRRRAIGAVRAAVADPAFRPKRGGRYVTSGVPVVVDGLAQAVQRSALLLLLAATLVMAATLALVFRTRFRLLPLAIGLAATAVTFGAVWLVGGSLTMASLAALPVLIGLAVDYAIQFQARFDEEPPGDPPRTRAERAAAAGGPTIATAGLATAAGFVILLLSPVPMVRSFGLILIVGILLAFAFALAVGFVALVLHRERPPRPTDLPPAFPRARTLARSAGRGIAHGRFTAPVRRAGSALRPAAARAAHEARTLRAAAGDLATAALGQAILRPRRVLGIALAVAVIGWAADTQSRVISDVRELVPQDLPALEDVRTLEQATGVTGEIDVTVRARDLTDPAVIAWMTRYQEDALAAHGYTPGDTCAQASEPPDLCPALSLPDLFRSVEGGDRGAVRGLLDAVPPYFSQGVVSRDRRTANLAFGIRLMSLERQKEVVDDLQRRLKPPPGVQAAVVGLPVLGAEGNAELASPLRRLATLLAGLLAVFAVLFAVRRSARRAAVPLIPIALATGWSALLLFVLRIPLNPMSVSLGALVIAISTEFSVLLSTRYEEERARGLSPGRAIERTYRSTGAAVLASGATAIAGFAALAASDIRMLRDFGIVTVVDLSVSLLGVMLVLPAALVWAEERGPFRLADVDPRRWGPAALRRVRALPGGLAGGARTAWGRRPRRPATTATAGAAAAPAPGRRWMRRRERPTAAGRRPPWRRNRA